MQHEVMRGRSPSYMPESRVAGGILIGRIIIAGLAFTSLVMLLAAIWIVVAR